MPNKECYASLQIVSTMLSASKMSAALGIKDAKVLEKGEPISNRPGASAATASIWRLESSLSRDRPLQHHLEQLLSMVGTRHEAVLALGQECQIEIWCFVSFDGSQCGIELAHSLLQTIAALPASLVFDIYGQS